jgi:5'-nucleotidase
MPDAPASPVPAGVIVTNDDGIDSPGLHSLAAAASAAGREVLVAAPVYEASGACASIVSF